MSLEVWGDEGDMGPPDGYVTEETYDEMVAEKDEEIQKLRQSLHSLALCERNYCNARRVFGSCDFRELDSLEALRVSGDEARETLSSVDDSAKGGE